MPKVAERTEGRVSVTIRRPPGRTVRRTVPIPLVPLRRGGGAAAVLVVGAVLVSMLLAVAVTGASVA
ncbi:SpdD-like protein, partial [Streptomyces sp. 900116325]